MIIEYHIPFGIAGTRDRAMQVAKVNGESLTAKFWVDAVTELKYQREWVVRLASDLEAKNRDDAWEKARPYAIQVGGTVYGVSLEPVSKGVSPAVVPIPGQKYYLQKPKPQLLHGSVSEKWVVQEITGEPLEIAGVMMPPIVEFYNTREKAEAAAKKYRAKGRKVNVFRHSGNPGLEDYAIPALSTIRLIRKEIYSIHDAVMRDDYSDAKVHLDKAVEKWQSMTTEERQKFVLIGNEVDYWRRMLARKSSGSSHPTAEEGSVERHSKVKGVDWETIKRDYKLHYERPIYGEYERDWYAEVLDPVKGVVATLKGKDYVVRQIRKYGRPYVRIYVKKEESSGIRNPTPEKRVTRGIRVYTNRVEMVLQDINDYIQHQPRFSGINVENVLSMNSISEIVVSGDTNRITELERELRRTHGDTPTVESPKRRAVIRYTKTHVLVLCPLGHLLESHKLDSSFAGSMLEAELSSRHEGDRFDRMAELCTGHGHEHVHESKTTGSSLSPLSGSPSMSRKFLEQKLEKEVEHLTLGAAATGRSEAEIDRMVERYRKEFWKQHHPSAGGPSNPSGCPRCGYFNLILTDPRWARCPACGYSERQKREEASRPMAGKPHKLFYVTYYELPNGKWEVPADIMSGVKYAVFDTEEEARNYIAKSVGEKSSTVNLKDKPGNPRSTEEAVNIIGNYIRTMQTTIQEGHLGKRDLQRAYSHAEDLYKITRGMFSMLTGAEMNAHPWLEQELNNIGKQLEWHKQKSSTPAGHAEPNIIRFSDLWAPEKTVRAINEELKKGFEPDGDISTNYTDNTLKMDMVDYGHFILGGDRWHIQIGNFRKHPQMERYYFNTLAFNEAVWGKSESEMSSPERSGG